MNQADQLRDWYWRCYGSHLRRFETRGFNNQKFYKQDPGGKFSTEDSFLDGLQLGSSTLTLVFGKLEEAEEFAQKYLLDDPNAQRVPVKASGRFCLYVTEDGDYAREWVWKSLVSKPDVSANLAQSDAELCARLMKSLGARDDSGRFEAAIRALRNALPVMM